MELKSFKEILLKKAEESGNSNLFSLIKFAKDEILIESVLESLEKMAQPSAAMGRGANSAVTTFAGNLTNTDVEQVRDALAHHISHYRSALKAGNREVADKHLEKIIPMMHLVGRAAKHSNGKLGIDYRSTTPWESNYTTLERHPHNGKLKEGTKDLGRRPTKKARATSQRSVPDYHYLEMMPHHEHGDTKGIANPDSGYPFEETQVGSQEAIDSGKAWLPIQDVEASQYAPHPFDAHPIHQHADMPESERSPEHNEKFAQDLASWRSSEPHKQWLASQKESYTKDPEAYKNRGTVKPGHFWEGLNLQPSPDHAKRPAAPAPETPIVPKKE